MRANGVPIHRLRSRLASCNVRSVLYVVDGMRSIGVSEILADISARSGQPSSEMATDEVRIALRVATAASFGAGKDGLAAGVRELLRGLIRLPLDEAIATSVAVSSAQDLAARNGAHMAVDERALVLLLREGLSGDAGHNLDAVLDWAAGSVQDVRRDTSAGRSRRRAKQGTRLFGPVSLKPIEVVIGLAHPVAGVPISQRARAVQALEQRIGHALREAEADVEGRLSLRLMLPPSHLGPDSQVDDDDLWRGVSGYVLADVHGLIVCDLNGVAASDGSALQRALHHAQAGSGLWIRDPGAARGRLSGAWAREAGWKVVYCAEQSKVARVIRTWVKRNADELEWAARSRSDLQVVYEPVRERLERALERLEPAQRRAVRLASGLTEAELDRALTDVFFMDTLRGWQLDALRSASLIHARARHDRSGLTPRVNWPSLESARREFGWSAETAVRLREHVMARLARPGVSPLKSTLLQPSDWLALKRDLGL